MDSVEGKSLIKSGKFGSNLYSLNAPNSIYENQVLLLDLHGPNSFSQAFDTGFLLGQEFLDNYDKLMISLLGEIN